MKEETKNLYEGMFVVNASLTDDARQKAFDKILDLIKSQNGEVEKHFEMGRRRLSFEIERHKEGYYHVLYFSVHPSAVAEMWKEFHLMEDLVRFMTLRAEAVPESLEFKSLEEAQSK